VTMSIARKAYSVFNVVLMLEYLAQFYLIASAFFTVTNANDDPKSVYSAFKNADTFAGLHAINGWPVIGTTTLILIGLAFAARHPWRTTLLTALLFVLLLLQLLLARAGMPVLSAVHGLNALVLVGLNGWLTRQNWAFRRTSIETAVQ
jgi:hypothetical protein